MFDARAAKALNVGEHVTVDEAPGLRLIATKTRRTWVYRYKSPLDGRMRRVRLGHWPAMGLHAALVAWHRLKEERDGGADPAADKRERRSQAAAEAWIDLYTVRRVCDDFLQSYAGAVAAKTFAEAKRLLTIEIDQLADRPAANITRADAFDLIHGKRHKPVVAASLRRLLGAAWDQGLDAGRLAPTVPNWWRLILLGKLPSKGKVIAGKHQGERKHALSEAELSQLLHWLPNFSRDVEDGLTLYLWTCCRGSEIVAMAREEIGEEPDGLWWTVPRAKLKMRRNPLTTDLRVPLVGRAEAIVRRRMDAVAGGWLFPSRGRSGHIEQKVFGVAVWTHLQRCALRPEWVRPRLPIDDFAPHDLRRTGRTLLAALGCPDAVAEAILGHIPPGIVGTYNRHPYEAERRQWLPVLAARLEVLAASS
jgi:integrase